MKLIMADMDGTLFDTRMVNYKAYNESLSCYGLNIDYDYYCKYCNGKSYMDFLRNIANNDIQLMECIHKKKQEVYSNYVRFAQANELLLDILRLVKVEYKIALVTTASKMCVFQLLEMFQVKDIFDLILTSEDINLSKPNPEGYIKAMKYFSSLPEECLILEDSEEGRLAAENAEVNYVMVSGYS